MAYLRDLGQLRDVARALGPAPARLGAAGRPMLVDRHLPVYETSDVLSVVVEATADRAWAALRELDFMEVARESAGVRTLSSLRALPARLRGRPFDRRSEHAGWDELTGPGSPWVLLGEVPGFEIATGLVGRFWRADAGMEQIEGAAFAGFERPGYAKLVLDFSVRPFGEHRSLVSAEMRTATTDAAARRRFRAYWTLIGPGARYLVKQDLAWIKADAERLATAG